MAEPQAGFLQEVARLTRSHGALLVFDETITGFRTARRRLGLLRRHPGPGHLRQGLANGFPVSAVAGRRDLMKLMEEIFFSFTFGGETLSLAASAATLDKLKEPRRVRGHLARLGRRLMAGIGERIARHGVGDLLAVAGHRAGLSCSSRTPHGQPVADQDVVPAGNLRPRHPQPGHHNLSYAHSDADIDRLLAVHDEVFPLLPGRRPRRPPGRTAALPAPGTPFQGALNPPCSSSSAPTPTPGSALATSCAAWRWPTPWPSAVPIASFSAGAGLGRTAARIAAAGHDLYLVPEAAAAAADEIAHSAWLPHGQSRDAELCRGILQRQPPGRLAGGGPLRPGRPWQTAFGQPPAASWSSTTWPTAATTATSWSIRISTRPLPSATPDLPAAAGTLTGPRHALLRPEFARLRQAALARRLCRRAGTRPPGCSSVFGGSDAADLTGRTMSFFSPGRPRRPVDVVVGPSTRRPSPGGVSPPCPAERSHVNPGNVAELMAAADLAIGSPEAPAGSAAPWARRPSPSLLPPTRKPWSAPG